MSNPRAQTGGMKWNRMLELLRPQEELVAAFGRAELVRTLEGRYELRGGTTEDRQKAGEWISLFLHEAHPVIRN